MFEIIGEYRDSHEVVDSAKTWGEALHLQREYEMAFGPQWSIYIKNTKTGEYEPQRVY